MKKLWDDRAWGEYQYWQTQDKRTLKKINELIRDIERTGEKGVGRVELLKGNLAGWRSVRIDEKNRLVFRIADKGDEQVLEILQCRFHYSDK